MSDTAVVERVMAYYPQTEEGPAMVSNERAVLPCGCAIYVGVRLDTREAATGATPCGQGSLHEEVINRASVLIWDSTQEGAKEKYHERLLVEVCAELLTKAWEEVICQGNTPDTR